MSSGCIDIPALGRHVELGMLYNIWTDKFLQGTLLWDEANIEKNAHVEKSPEIRSAVSLGDSLKNKTSALDMKASLKASFMGGLVEVGGSASFLQNNVSSEKQCRVTLRHEEETEYKSVHVNDMGEVKYPQVFSEQTATHVVIGLVYGAKAFMVFDKFASESEDKTEVMGQLNAVVKKIPSVDVSGSVELNMSQEEKRHVNSVKCTYHGDIRLDIIPTNFEEAVSAFKQLPNLIKESGSAGEPVKVKLYPLWKLNSNAAKLVKEIREDLTADLEDVMGHLKEARIRASDLISVCTLMKVDPIKAKLTKFRDELIDFTVLFKKNLGKLLPEIRAGREQDQKLVDMLNFYEESPFNHSQMHKWLNEKQTEINLLKTHIDKVSGVSIEPPGPELNTYILDSTIKWLYVLNFTSLEYEEPYLATLTKCMDMEQFKKMEEVSVARQSFGEIQPWFKNPDVTGRMRTPIEDFKYYSDDYISIISYMRDPEYPGACRHLYSYGKLYSRK